MSRESISSCSRLGTDSVKWGLYGDDVLPLWVADTDFQSPSAVIEALHQRVDHGVFGYPLNPPELAELVVARMAAALSLENLPQGHDLHPRCSARV